MACSVLNCHEVCTVMHISEHRNNALTDVVWEERNRSKRVTFIFLSWLIVIYQQLEIVTDGCYGGREE